MTRRFAHLGWMVPLILSMALHGGIVSGAGECLSNPCINGGICTEDSGTYSCECLEFYFGTNCEIDQYYCPDCMNNGSTSLSVLSCDSAATSCLDGPGVEECIDGNCMSSLHQCGCDCSPDYTGLQCETELTGEMIFQTGAYFCSNCLNNGVPTATLMSCSDSISSSCLNNPGLEDCIGGDCVSSLHSCGCYCPYGYTGLQCETAPAGKSGATKNFMDTLRMLGLVIGGIITRIVAM